MAATGYGGHVRLVPGAPAPARIARRAVDSPLTAVHGMRSAEALLALQRTAGNRATVALLAGPPRQAQPGPVVQRVLDPAETADLADLETWMATYRAAQTATKGPAAGRAAASRALATYIPDLVVKSRRLTELKAKHLLPSDAEQAVATAAAAARLATDEAARQAAAARAASDAAATTAAKARFAAQITDATGSVAAVAALQAAAQGFLTAVPNDPKLKRERRVAARLAALKAARLAADRAHLAAAAVTGTTVVAEANAFQAAGARAVTDATAARDALPGEIATVRTTWLLSAQTDYRRAAESIARGYQGAVRLTLHNTYVSGPDVGKGFGAEYEPAGRASSWVVHVHRTKPGVIVAATTKPGSNRGLLVGVDIPMIFRDRLNAIGVPGTDTRAGVSFKRQLTTPNFATPQPDLDAYRAGR